MDRLNFIVWTSGGILAGVAGKRHCHPNMAPQIIAQALLVSCRTGFSGAFRMLSISFYFCSACSQRPSATKSQTAPMSLLGQKRTNHRGPKSTVVRYCPKAVIDYVRSRLLISTIRIDLRFGTPAAKLHPENPACLCPRFQGSEINILDA